MIIDAIYDNRPPRLYPDYSPTLRRERQGLLVVEIIERSKSYGMRHTHLHRKKSRF